MIRTAGRSPGLTDALALRTAGRSPGLTDVLALRAERARAAS